MSLQVWLPLTGDLHNQGLSNSVFTNDGATIDNNGKIGKCYSFASGNFLSSTLSLSATGPWSAAAWIYPTTSSSGSHQYIIGLNGTSATNFLFTLCIYNNKISVRFAGTTYSADVTYTTNTWYHACFTYDGTQLKIYINGVLNKTYTSTVAPVAATNLYIGKRGGNTGYYVGKLNDVRIYDHALSDKEVEEIAKGLVLHYKLDNNGLGNPNILTGTYYNSYVAGSSATNANGLWTGGSGGNGTFSVTEDSTCPVGRYSWNVLNNTSGNRDFQQGNEPYVSGQVYTTSFWAKGSGTCLYRSWNTTDGKGMFSKTWTLTANWTYYTYTFTASEEMETDSCTFHLGVSGNSSINICGMKMEKGDKATPYCPAIGEMTEPNVIYDSSGYGNDGLIFDPLTITTDTLKYNVATVFDGNTSAIKVPYTDIASTDDIFTLNLWFKKNELGSKNYETLFGGPSGFEMDTRAGTATSLTLYMASTRGSNFAQFNFGEWYMVTLVNDGTNELYYVNTELKKTIAKKPMPAGNYYIGAWQTEIKQNYKGFISDFRIYKTALTADQILELYNTSATIDNKGNVYAREVIE